MAFIDRQNVGFAKLQMVSDLHLSEASYGFGSSLFFIGYVFTLGSSLGNMLGGLANGFLLDLNSMGGLAGWQWVFIGTGTPAVLLTFAVLLYLPASPQSAYFLDASERQILAAAHARRRSRVSAYNNPWAALWDPTVIAFGAVYMLYATAFYGVTYWLPTIVKAFWCHTDRERPVET